METGDAQNCRMAVQSAGKAAARLNTEAFHNCERSRVERHLQPLRGDANYNVFHSNSAGIKDNAKKLFPRMRDVHHPKARNFRKHF